MLRGRATGDGSMHLSFLRPGLGPGALLGAPRGGGTVDTGTPSDGGLTTPGSPWGICWGFPTSSAIDDGAAIHGATVLAVFAAATAAGRNAVGGMLLLLPLLLQLLVAVAAAAIIVATGGRAAAAAAAAAPYGDASGGTIFEGGGMVCALKTSAGICLQGIVLGGGLVQSQCGFAPKITSGGGPGMYGYMCRRIRCCAISGMELEPKWLR